MITTDILIGDTHTIDAHFGSQATDAAFVLVGGKTWLDAPLRLTMGRAQLARLRDALSAALDEDSA